MEEELRLESLFNDALRSAERAADGDNIGDLEPEAIAFLDAVSLASAHRGYIVEMLIAAALTARETDLFEYLFHYMRWPELRSFVEGLKRTWGRNPRRMNALSHLMEAFDNDHEVEPWFKGYHGGQIK